MKNISSNWKKWANRLACVCAVALFSMSLAACSEAYDDSALVERIDNLEKRIEAIEKKLNEQVSALQQLAELAESVDELNNKVEGFVGVQSANYDEATGKWVILLSDGKTLEVLADVEEAKDVVSAKADTDGKLYWAIDGEFIKDANGNKVSVIITPKVRVNETTKEYEVSVDGGLTWHPTGLILEEKENTPGETEKAPALFTEVDQDENYVYFTQADGTMLKIEKATKGVEINMLVGKQWIPAGESRTIEFKAAGAEKFFISKPNGWAANIENNLLTITAPAENAAGAELKGKVQVLAVSANGMSSVSEVTVEVGEAPVTVSIVDGQVKFTVSETTKNDSSWNGYIRGLRKLSEFDPQAIYEDYASGVGSRNLLKDDFSISLEQMIKNHGMQMEGGETYVVWAFNTTVEIVEGWWGPEETIVPESPENILYTTHTVPEMKVEFSNVTFADATMNLSVKGYDTVYFLVNEFVAFDEADKADQIAYAKEEFIALVNDEYFWPSSYTLADQYKSYNGSFDAFFYETQWSNLAAGSTYQFLMIPAEALTIENLVSVDVTLPFPVVGETNASVELSNLSVDFKYAKATITPNADCFQYRYYWLTEEDVAANNTDELIVKHLYEKTYSPETEAYDAQYSSLVPGAKIWLYVLAIDKNGAASIIKEEFTAPELTFLEDTKIYVEAAEVGMDYVKIKITGDEGVVKYNYRNMSYTGNYGTYTSTYGDDATAELKVAMNDGYNFTMKNVDEITDNTLEFKALTFGSEYIFFGVGYDAEGKPTHMAQIRYTPGGQFMEKFDSELTAQPTITAVYFTKDSYSSDNITWTNAADATLADLCDSEGLVDYGMYKFDIDWGTIKVKNYWVYMGTTSYIDPSLGAYTATQAIIKNAIQTRSYGGWPEGSEGWSNYTGLRQAKWNSDYTEQTITPQQVYIAWEDEDGNFYPYMLIDQESFFKAE